LVPLIIFILEHLFTSTRLIDTVGLSCDVDFSPWFVRLINIFLLTVLPTFINVPVVFMIIQHVRFSQNTVRSVRRIHRRLITQSIMLYTFWLLCFIPEIIFMFPIVTADTQSWVGNILNILGVLTDALVITLFDRRFIDAWKKSIHKILVFFRLVQGRIHPVENIQLRKIRSVG
jgi:hypothetical protein